MKTALLIVDVQKHMLWDHPAHEHSIVPNIARLACLARQNGVEVIYVQHDSSPKEELAMGTEGWEIAAGLEPQQGERVFSKRFNSAFKGTGLADYLHAQGITRLIVCGMQAEYCIDTTIKVAFELGFELFVPRQCVSTYDTKWLNAQDLCDFYLDNIWNGRFATVLPAWDIEQIMLHVSLQKEG